MDTNNKRIAKNTIMLYFRMLLTMVVALYTSRVVLAQLGIEDYGIYNVVGGVVSMFTFLNAAMSTSTQRFLTIELGKGNLEGLKNVFATALNIHIAIGLAIILLSETIGLWFVNVKLVIPQDRLFAANWVYQFAILTMFVNIIQVPYNSILIAHERMSVYAYISILEVVLKLLIVYLLVISPFDKLIFYAFLLLVVQVIIRVIYQIYCRHYYIESRFRLYWNKFLYKKMTYFAGWNLMGSLAWMFRDQGVNIILNLFFGPAINAARGIATQVSSAVMGFISNFQVALNPQITKNYAIGKINDMEKLAYLGLKFSYMILFIIAFPLALNINYVLSLWLVKVPDYAGIFVILVMVDSLISNLFGSPLMTSLAATGNIKNYQIVVSILVMCTLPFSYLALRMGLEATSVFYVTILFSLIAGCARLLFCHIQIGFSVYKMARGVLLPLLLMTLVSLPIPLMLKHMYLSQQNIKNFALLCSISILITGLSEWYIGMNKTERNSVWTIVKSKIRK